MITGITEQLALHTARLRFEDIPPEAIEKAKDCILDQIGVELIGSTLEWNKIAYRYVVAMGGRAARCVPYSLQDGRTQRQRINQLRRKSSDRGCGIRKRHIRSRLRARRRRLRSRRPPGCRHGSRSSRGLCNIPIQQTRLSL